MSATVNIIVARATKLAAPYIAGALLKLPLMMAIILRHFDNAVAYQRMHAWKASVYMASAIIIVDHEELLHGATPVL